jgi:dTDP-glucose 4,6-dehydratase
VGKLRDMSKTVLVSGGCGFAGHHLVEHLLANTDWEIIVLDSLTYAGRVDRLTDMVGYDPKRVSILWHDLRSPIPSHFPDVNYILHLAAESHVERSITDPVPFVHNNMMGTTHMVDWARNLDNLEHIVQISTDEVYGPAPVGYAHREWIDPMLPSNPYAASKVAQEAVAISYWRTFGLPLTITNTMNLFGERQDLEKFIPMTIKAVAEGRPVHLHAKIVDGEPIFSSRHWLHARNHADALLWILRETKPFLYGDPANLSDPTPRPNRWNVSGEEMDVLEVALLIGSFFGKETVPYTYEDYHTSRPGHDHRYALDNSKILSAGWRPPLTMADALERAVKWTMNNTKWMQ